MARPDELPEPRAGEDAPFGATADLQRMASAVPDEPSPLELAFADQMDASASEEAWMSAVEDEDLSLDDDLNEGFDELLFGPTTNPDEPLTAGAPFGPGPSLVPRPHETEQEFLGRVAEEIRRAPGANSLVQQFAERIERGE